MKSNDRTSESVASKAAQILNSPTASKAEKSVAGSALAQRAEPKPAAPAPTNIVGRVKARG